MNGEYGNFPLLFDSLPDYQGYSKDFLILVYSLIGIYDKFSN